MSRTSLRVAERQPKAAATTVGPHNPHPELVWQGAEYPLLDPGIYLVRGTEVQGPDWLRRYNRWSLRIEFALVHEPGSVSAFFNFGNDRSKPKVGRRSNYWRAWVLANGEVPHKGQSMTPEIFLEGQFFEVEVDSSTTREDGTPKPNGEVYSRITSFISVRWP